MNGIAGGDSLGAFQRIKSLFNALVDLPVAEREAALATFNLDPATRSKVLLMLNDNTTDADTLASVIDAVAGELAGRSHGAELAPGDSVGAWRLMSEIGRGGMGSVFLVERSDGHFQQQAALKLLAGVASQRAMAHLSRERQILAGLTHPSIARLLDGGATPRGQPYFVLEYVNGEAIDKFCTAKALSRFAILRLFVDVCKAVAFAHRKLVVHCDLKPSNIMVAADGRPILLDFGVSRLLDVVVDVGDDVTEDAAEPTATAVTRSETLTSAAYTPRYASPEQKAGGRVGIETDVYSLGVMLAELLGGKVSDGTLQDLDFDNADLKAIIGRATAPRVADRYQGADEFAADLQRFMLHEPVAARPATVSYVSTKFVRRHWPGLLGLAAFVITVSVFSWRAMIERDQAVNAERTARSVKDYMISVFQGADPEISGQRDLPVSTLLDAGRERLTAALKNQPQSHAEITGILGSVYHSIGKREQALKMFAEAIQIERRNNRPAMLADLLYKQAYTVYDMEDFPRAEPLAKEVLALREKIAPESVETLTAQRLVGMIYSFLGNDAAANLALTKAVALAEKLTGDTSVEAGRAYLAFGQHRGTVDGGAADAVTYAQRASRIFAQKLGNSHHLYADALEILGLGLSLQGKYDEATSMGKQLSDIRTKIYGELSNQNGFGLYTYANFLHQAGRRLEAVAIFERCVAIQEKLDGRGTLATAQPLELLVHAKVAAGAYADALALIDEVVAVRTKAFPADNVDVLMALATKGHILRQLGRLADAERVTRAVLTTRLAAPNAQKFRIAQSHLELAAVYRLQGKVDEATAQLVAARDAGFRPTPARASLILSEQALLHAARGRNEDALKLQLEAEDLLNQAGRQTHPDTWLLKLDRAETLIKLGQRQAARDLARQISEGAKASIEPTGAIARRLVRVMS